MLQRALLVLSFSIIALAASGCGSSSSTGRTGGLEKTFVVDSTSVDSVTVIPGPEYEAGWLHKVFFGEHWRQVWTAPVKVPLINLSTFAGGLTPLRQGGGFQTRSLRFQGQDGRLYVFRSVNKDPRKVLPEDLRDTFAADVFQDQISSSHPAAALVVDVLADAVGVLHARPLLCMLPDDERLAQFRQDFAGIIGIIEEYPTEGPNDSAGFAGSTKIVSTLKLFEKLDENSEDRVDSRAFLRARLLDILVGDWDRHIDQWRWARFKQNGADVYYPIPRDRDQAFARLDGALPWVSIRMVDQFESFTDDVRSVYGYTFSGRYLDRRILVDLSRPVWDSVTASVIARWTDAVIDSAVGRLPGTLHEKGGDWLAAALKSRRDDLTRASDKYYRLQVSYVDVRLSDKREYVEVNRVDDERVEVTAWRRNKDSGEPEGGPVYQRTFFTSETNEIRIYLLGSDDKAIVRGNVGSSIKVRIIGGKGDDELIDESIVHGLLLGFIPFIPNADHKTYFYDAYGDNMIVAGPSCSIDKEKYE